MFRILIDPAANRGVGVAFSDRHGGVSDPERMGSLNLGRTLDDDIAHVEANFERVRRVIGVPKMVTASQVHGVEVVTVDQGFLGRWGPRSHLGSPGGTPPLPEADAMVTTLADVALCIRVADCVPVLLADLDRGILGAAHAGRVGFLDGVVERTLERMHHLGARDIVAWIGPHVCGDCYEVPADMAEQVGATHPEVVTTTSWGTPSLDLGRGVEHVLDERGALAIRLDPCTRTDPDLHSHRRDGERAGRLGAFIWRVSGPA